MACLSTKKQLTMIAGFHNGKWTLYNEKCEWFNRAMPEVLKMGRMTETMEESHDKPSQSMKSYMSEIERMRKDSTGHSTGFLNNRRNSKEKTDR